MRHLLCSASSPARHCNRPWRPAPAGGCTSTTKRHDERPTHDRPVPGTAGRGTARACYSFNSDQEQCVLIGHFESAAGLHSRQQLRLTLKQKLGVELDS